MFCDESEAGSTFRHSATADLTRQIAPGNSNVGSAPYTIDEVLEMISIALNDTFDVALGWATVLISSATRVKKDGRTIRDEAVFECHGKKPHPELLSLVLRGDGKNHSKKKKAVR
jgi:hypothetical protein